MSTNIRNSKKDNLGLNLLSDNTSYRQISLRLKPARLSFRVIEWLHRYEIWQAQLSRDLENMTTIDMKPKLVAMRLGYI